MCSDRKSDSDNDSGFELDKPVSRREETTRGEGSSRRHAGKSGGSMVLSCKIVQAGVA